MTLSPKLRSVLTAVAALLAAFVVVLPTISGVPTEVGAVLGAILAALAALGIVPPQTGGTQEGVVNPTIVEPPAADVVEQEPLTGFNGGL